MKYDIGVKVKISRHTHLTPVLCVVPLGQQPRYTALGKITLKDGTYHEDISHGTGDNQSSKGAVAP
jgi:hypothetical protein